ncbi:N-acetylneuraminate synthase family protein [Aquimarina mytili]|uniref:N-acetylneuraminate synthase family protein n=1 Tax=Aquimarina mytili TaxID=874423 RepID=A0A936ZS85_9FLAO|nr:N-acetylneuraminate synthase family protein [Aquimarina mytili]MBL0684674.1 N-acetylneuraminate synthase family protein [Aquimarina mytili]
MSYYLYTETAFHHQGELEYARKLIEATKDSGASGIKFQVIFNINNLTSSKHSKYEFLKTLEFSEKEWEELFDYAIDLGLDLIIMPLDLEPFTLIEKYKKNIKFLEIHSVSFNDQQLKEKVKESGVPLILGAGGRTLEEINQQISFFQQQVSVLMHGFQSYPSKIEHVRLEKISTLAKKFPKIAVGYADHSSYDSEFSVLSNDYAYLLGARVFEKHITVDEGIERVDFEAAVSKDKIKKINSRLNFLSTEIFSEIHREFSNLNEQEITYKNREKIAVASKDIKKGEELNKDNVCFKMIDKVSDYTKIHQLEHKIAIKDISFDEVILKKDITRNERKTNY